MVLDHARIHALFQAGHCHDFLFRDRTARRSRCAASEHALGADRQQLHERLSAGDLQVIGRATARPMVSR